MATRAPASRRPEPASDPPILAALSPPQAPAVDHFGLALYYQRVSDFDKALIHYRALLEQNEASAEVHNNLGLLYQDRGQMDDAMAQFQRAIAIDPRYVRAHNNLGVALMRNNLEFFGRSKNADKLREDVNRQIDEQVEQLKALKGQLKILRQV